jgi:hypothetical protein
MLRMLSVLLPNPGLVFVAAFTDESRWVSGENETRNADGTPIKISRVPCRGAYALDAFQSMGSMKGIEI